MALHVTTEQILGSVGRCLKKKSGQCRFGARGRPRKHLSESRREIFYFRANPELARKIRQSAAIMGRSRTEEIEIIVGKHYSYGELSKALTQERKDVIRDTVREVLFELLKCENVTFLLKRDTPLADALEAGLGAFGNIGNDVKIADQKIE
jgi:hypothetical protein